jgi:hypothetical protein
LSEDSFKAEIRLVNEEGFHKTILEDTFVSNADLVSLVKAFDEGRKFAVGVKSGGISASAAFEQGVFIARRSDGDGFLLGYQNPTGKLEVVR